MQMFLATQSSVVLEVIQRPKGDSQRDSWKGQCSSSMQRSLPIRCGEEEQDRRRQQHNAELKDMRARAFVGLRRLEVAGNYGQQRCERHDEYDLTADAVDSLRAHAVCASLSNPWLMDFAMR